MNGYARVKICADFTRVRFEQVDSLNQLNLFDKLRDDFYRFVPTARWDRRIRWMVIPNRDLRKVLDFCYSHFGTNKVDVVHETDNPPKPKQLFLGFTQIQEEK